jgi:hypothetical protein
MTADIQARADGGAKVNKALVVEAFDLLFNKRDYGAAKARWSENYIQHSALIAPGREGLMERQVTPIAPLREPVRRGRERPRGALRPLQRHQS